ncbi:MAG: DUF3857 domain-containing protein [Novosphingobium sp.]|nr:DUF3857 domain-containing protein [Novosphingobium sp.]
MTRACRFGLMTLLLCGAAPALAGGEPLYDAPPAWVQPVELTAKQLAAAPTIVLLDTQKRLEGGKVWDYSDLAYRIDNPDTLTAAGTLSASWIPDKGDLIVNRVEILRGGQVVDVLKEGAKFIVLRREAQLEQRSIDGMLTATMAVPGLRVGDVLRLAYTTVQADQALGDKVQSLDALPAGKFAVGSGRVRVSWPEGAPMKWQAGPGVATPQPVLKDGFETVEIAYPLPDQPDMPMDAPPRFRRPPLLQVGSFTSWAEVSRTLAKHFGTEGSIAKGGEIAGKIAGIEQQTADPLTRAALALRIVQDDISYLANGLDGGNYIPQRPADTWKLRYGDCKAKSLLLLAMLREMGIQADAVAVHHSDGDSAPELLPMPADFDHVIVRAQIGGETYWLDGTSSGSRLWNIGEVPPFRYALPVTKDGSDLVPMVQRPVTHPDQTLKLVLDQSAGVDMMALYDATIEVYGPVGASIRSMIAQPSEQARRTFAERALGSVLGQSNLLDYSLAYDEDGAKATITARGLTMPMWQFERGTAREALPGLPASGFAFSPDRARPAWKDVPVQMAGPFVMDTDLTVKLPDGGRNYTLQGREVVNSEIAGATITRDAAIAGDTLKVKERLSSTMTEIDPAALPAEKAKAARFAGGKLSVLAPADARRSWDAGPADGKRYAALEAAFAQLIAEDAKKDPKDRDAAGYMLRSAFRFQTLDWDGAIADMTAGIAVQPSAAAYLTRAHYYGEIGRYAEALADTRAAFELDPSPANGIAEASALAQLGKYDEALELVDTYQDDAENRVSAVSAKAEILGMAGKPADALALLDQVLAERPGDPGLLNGVCWTMGAWNLEQDKLLQQCTKAVENAEWAPPVLDSRAMAYFRLGRLQDALADYNAALSNEPGLAPTLYMRGIVRTRLGDKDAGGKDIAQALRISPAVKATYARYGIEAP